MTNNLDEFKNEEWIRENIDPCRERVDAFLERCSTVDLEEVMKVSDEAERESRIPKIIHFCFINYKELPDIYYLFFNRWLEIFGDEYMFVNWTPANLPANEYSKMCLKDRQWAFYADYARVYAVHEYGGFYLDCDIWPYRNFDELLDLPYVLDIEHSCLTTIDRRPRLEAGVFGARKENELIGNFLELYNMLPVIEWCDYKGLVAPFMWAEISEVMSKTILYNYGNLEDLRRFFAENEDANRFATLDGTYLSKTETDLPNRSILGGMSGIVDQHHEEHALCSHQFLSNWC